jgi:hypothetical protein
VSARISVKRVKEGDNQVDNDGQIEEDLTLDGHVRADPKEEEEDGARLGRLQFREETPLDDGVAAFQQGDAQLDRFHENVGR